MKNIIIIIVSVGIAFALLSTNNDSSNPRECNDETQITGQQYNVIGSEIHVRNGPGTNYDKIINQKASIIF